MSASAAERDPKRPRLDASSSSSSATPQVVVDGGGEQPITMDGTIDEAVTETHELVPEVFITLHASWNGKSHEVVLGESDRVLDLKDKLNALTEVPPERQKIIGLVKSKLPSDDVTIKTLALKPNKKFTLIGTPLGHELQSRPEHMPDVLNDFDIDVSQYPEMMLSFANDQRNVRKIREASEGLGDVSVMHEFREGKPLLVLDLDYTLIDTKPLTRGSLPPAECARPGLHKFLERCYEYYDICIWSQTSWVWLEAKLVELEMIGGDRPYKINFVLDHKPMFKVFSKKRPTASTSGGKKSGEMFTHSVKALKIIWNKFPRWNASNTIHIDDLARNFALNPMNGLKVDAWHGASELASSFPPPSANGGGNNSSSHNNGGREGGDHELSKLVWYLRWLVESGVEMGRGDHSQWRSVAKHLSRDGQVLWDKSTGKYTLVPLALGEGAPKIHYSSKKRGSGGGGTGTGTRTGEGVSS